MELELVMGRGLWKMPNDKIKDAANRLDVQFSLVNVIVYEIVLNDLVHKILR